jgi:hypothetical protein
MSGRRTRPRRLRWLLAALLGLALVTITAVTGCMERLFYHPLRAATRPPGHLSEPQTIWFRSGDGTRLHGWLFEAAGLERDRVPTVLHVHGNAGNVESHVFFTEHLPPAGFNLFIFDFRGYGRSEGSARRREALLADAEAALDHLLRRSDIDPARIGVYGQSLGGAIAILLAQRRPQVRAAVIESSFTSWREMAAAALGGDPPGPLSRLVARIFIRDTLRPVDAIRDCSVPILIIQGGGDTVVPPGHGRRLAAAAPGAELVELPGGDHNTLRVTHPQVDRLTIEFFRRHLADHVEHAPGDSLESGAG